VPPHLSTRFRDCFSPGVVNVTPRTKHGLRGHHDLDLAEFVELVRARHHFICAVYSRYTGKSRDFLMHQFAYAVNV
jgi:hypothetical protein